MFDHLLQLTVNGLCRKHLVHIATARLDKSGASAASSSSSPGVLGVFGAPENERRLLKFVVPKSQSWLVILKMEILIESTHLIKKPPPGEPCLGIS